MARLEGAHGEENNSGTEGALWMAFVLIEGECGAKWEIKEEQSQVHAIKQSLPSNFGDQVKAFAPGNGKLLSRIQKKEII